eukprot:TRINITY_DN10154_c0_g1_i3.p1 TRINITY_DN10154_c0_g1~~TRINITY_DN10154_c0_g1_i3.p1  ORF type:complete len:539 (+),score=76.62 TRINITY_DN10154_c0_g1_i3:260-1876(+)
MRTLRALHRTAQGLKICSRRCSSSNSIDPLRICTPIYYVNAKPHLGHFYTTILSDCIARWNAMKDRPTALFSTGTDEHGTKIEQAAAAADMDVRSFCHMNAAEFQLLADKSNVTITDFVRTTEPRHSEAVQALWQRLYDGGFIYEGSYQGWYCISDESFLTSQQVTDGFDKQGKPCKVSTASGHPVQMVQERNFMFALDKVKDKLLDWARQSEVIVPTFRQKEVLAMILELPDLSISRPATKLSWGISVPNDAEQTIYVWVDALANYLTVQGYPSQHPHPTVHVVGKDILKFHAVYWPALLLAADLPVPEQVIAHGHWTVDNVKMSKSLGNVVDPFDLLRQWTADPLRYYVMKESRLGADGDFSEARFQAVHHELADTLGNLLGRISSPKINVAQQVPAVDSICSIVREQQDVYTNAIDQVDKFYSCHEFGLGIEAILVALRSTNALMNECQPWKLVKGTDEDQARAARILATAFEGLRVAAICLAPVIPSTARLLLQRIGVHDDTQLLWSHVGYDTSRLAGRLIQPGPPLISKEPMV